MAIILCNLHQLDYFYLMERCFSSILFYENSFTLLITYFHLVTYCRKGIKVSLGFFEDVTIPAEMLQQPAQWHEAGREWSWAMEENEPPLYYTRGGEIRIKTHGIKFHAVPSLAKQAEQRAAGEAVEGSAALPHAPMVVVGRADSTGLGMIGWAWG